LACEVITGSQKTAKYWVAAIPARLNNSALNQPIS
jgi:hypothetical protein